MISCNVGVIIGGPGHAGHYFRPGYSGKKEKQDGVGPGGVVVRSAVPAGGLQPSLWNQPK